MNVFLHGAEAANSELQMQFMRDDRMIDVAIEKE